MDNVPSQLISRLKEKRRLLNLKDKKHKEIKTALVIDGGAMKGAYSAGAIAALKTLGLENVFDLVIAVSSGTISASYFLSGQGNLAPKVFYEGLASKKFINLYKLHPARVVGTEYGVDVFTKRLPLNQEAVLKSRSEYFIGVTNPDSGKGEYLNIKKDNIDVITGMYASSTVPFLQNKIVTIHEKIYLDGMIGCGIPIDIALEHKCTDILIIENTPVGKPDLASPLMLKLFFTFFTFQGTLSAKKAIFEKKKRYYETLRTIYNAQKRGINIEIIAPKKTIAGTFTINSKKLQQISEQGEKTMLQLFSLLSNYP